MHFHHHFDVFFVFFVKIVQNPFSFFKGYAIIGLEPGNAISNLPGKKGTTMKIIVNGKQMNVRDSLRELAIKKLGKFDRIFGDEAEATVTFSAKRDQENIEITIRKGSTIFRSEESANAFATALDSAVDKLLGQIRRNKTRLERQLRDDTLQLSDPVIVEDAWEEEPEFKIRRKSFSFKPMSVEEAILQMNLLEHDFYVFTDAIRGDTCVVYRRKDGNYGLITPGEE